jgi:hypothetical protein
VSNTNAQVTSNEKIELHFLLENVFLSKKNNLFDTIEVKDKIDFYIVNSNFGLFYYDSLKHSSLFDLMLFKDEKSFLNHLKLNKNKVVTRVNIYSSKINQDSLVLKILFCNGNYRSYKKKQNWFFKKRIRLLRYDGESKFILKYNEKERQWIFKKINN